MGRMSQLCRESLSRPQLGQESRLIGQDKEGYLVRRNVCVRDLTFAGERITCADVALITTSLSRSQMFRAKHATRLDQTGKAGCPKSLVECKLSASRAVDMLTEQAFGSYRDLEEGAGSHPSSFAWCALHSRVTS